MDLRHWMIVGFDLPFMARSDASSGARVVCQDDVLKS